MNRTKNRTPDTDHEDLLYPLDPSAPLGYRVPKPIPTNPVGRSPLIQRIDESERYELARERLRARAGFTVACIAIGGFLGWSVWTIAQAVVP